MMLCTYYNTEIAQFSEKLTSTYLHFAIGNL